MLQNLKCSLESTMQEVSLLRSRIVHNPSQLKDAIKNMGNNVTSTTAHLSTLTTKLHALTSRLNQMTLVSTEISTCLKIMSECRADCQEYSKLSAHGASLRESLDTLQLSLRDASVKQSQALRQVAACGDRIDRLMKHQSGKKKVVDEGIRVLQEDYAVVLEEREKALEVVESNSAIVRDLEREVSVMEGKVGKVRSMVEECMVVLCEHLEEYQATTDLANC